MVRLVDCGKRFHVQFESLVVLPLDLQFGLQFFDQEFETRNFRLEFLDVATVCLWPDDNRCVETGGLRLRCRMLWNVRGWGNEWQRVRLRCKRVSQGVRPGCFHTRFRLSDRNRSNRNRLHGNGWCDRRENVGK